MPADSVAYVGLIIAAAAGVVAGVVFERTRGAAAKRAAKFEADLVQARSELMRYREETQRHFGKSAELLGRMATDYREFLDHFVSGAEALCGPNMKAIDANGLDRPLLDAATGIPLTTPADSMESEPLAEDAPK